MLIYLALGFFFMLFIKLGEASLDKLELPEEMIADLRLSTFQTLIMIVTWPLWLLSYLAFVITSVSFGDENDRDK